MDTLLARIIERGQAEGQRRHAAHVRFTTWQRRIVAIALTLVWMTVLGAILFAQAGAGANQGTGGGAWGGCDYHWCEIWQWFRYIQQVF